MPTRHRRAFVEDPAERRRLLKLASVDTALASKTLHVICEEKRRKEQKPD